MFRAGVLLLPIAALALITLEPPPVDAWQAPEATPSPPVVFDVVLVDVHGREVGVAYLREAPNGRVAIGVLVKGLPPGEHGIHIHETGECDRHGDMPFALAGGHY